MSIEFTWLWALAALPLPLLIARLLPRAASQPEPALKLPFDAALVSTVASGNSSPIRAGLVLATLAWILLVIAAARPISAGEPVQLPVSGRDLIMAVDISGSMEAKDMVIGNKVTSRITAVKAVAGEFIERRDGDRLGLILFGDQAYLQTPLTFDRETARTQLNEAVIGLAGRRTAIGDAIGLAVKRLREQPLENRVLILLTDGDNTAGVVDPLKAAQLAKHHQVRIYTIGIGAGEMLVQGFFGRQQLANTELDELSLTTIAETTGGRYFRAQDIEELDKIYQLIDAIEPVSEEQQTYRPRTELYQWPLGAALTLTLFIALMRLSRPLRNSTSEVRHA